MIKLAACILPNKDYKVQGSDTTADAIKYLSSQTKDPNPSLVQIISHWQEYTPGIFAGSISSWWLTKIL